MLLGEISYINILAIVFGTRGIDKMLARHEMIEMCMSIEMGIVMKACHSNNVGVCVIYHGNKAIKFSVCIVQAARGIVVFSSA